MSPSALTVSAAAEAGEGSGINSGAQGQSLYSAGGTTVSGTSTLFVSQGGNIGIGTTTPGSLLSLSGIANLTAATSTFYSTGGINLKGGCFSINGACIGEAWRRRRLAHTYPCSTLPP